MIYLMNKIRLKYIKIILNFIIMIMKIMKFLLINKYK